jgi:hypothetical protein
MWSHSECCGLMPLGQMLLELKAVRTNNNRKNAFRANVFVTNEIKPIELFQIEQMLLKYMQIE